MMNKQSGKKIIKSKNWITAVFMGILPSCFLHSQEVLTTITRNPVLVKKYAEVKNHISQIRATIPDTLHLPFLDDFSKDNIYPDTELWLDSNVFINRTYPIAPPTLGVATFDGVSKSGCPYDTTLTNPGISLSADTLLSKPIDLSLLPSDSVYLSFFWQAEGRGNDPEPGDSLALDFFNPTTGTWKNAWSKKGYNPSQGDTVFRLVMIPVSDTAFLKNAFQFRFRNKATVSGNVDHWHIDYVLLDKNRNMNDTVFDDVAFAYSSRSLLKNYYAMPWEQYQPSEMKTNLDFFIRNNASVTKNTFFNYQIYDHVGSVQANYTGGSDNCNPFATDGYWNNPLMNTPGIGTNVPPPLPLIPYSFPSLTDTASFTLECTLNTSPDKDQWNDTLRFKQNFYNYYAYDDGTVEAGYGLNYYGGQIAYKFSLNKPDTLFALQMLFNWIPPKVSPRQFQIGVWNDAGGFPGTLIYLDSLVSPKYQYQFNNTWGNLTNMFYPYLLSTPQKLSGTFYVGWIQYTADLLNIGFDRNTQNNGKMFFNVGNGWSQSQIPGSWMIRPVVGSKNGLLEVKEEVQSAEFKVYPNPSNGQFTVSTPQPEIGHKYNLTIYNQLGELVLNQVLPSKLQTINLDAPNGIYFLRITNQGETTHSWKLILSK